MAHAPDLVVLSIACVQAKSKAEKARTLRALRAGVAFWREVALEPGRCPECGYKRRTRKDLLVDLPTADQAATQLRRLGKVI